jgi:hypothetical protein
VINSVDIRNIIPDLVDCVVYDFRWPREALLTSVPHLQAPLCNVSTRSVEVTKPMSLIGHNDQAPGSNDLGVHPGPTTISATPSLAEPPISQLVRGAATTEVRVSQPPRRRSVIRQYASYPPPPTPLTPFISTVAPPRYPRGGSHLPQYAPYIQHPRPIVPLPNYFAEQTGASPVA